jgi:glycine/D-amino acid oxidase-like deaminating enzyme
MLSYWQQSAHFSKIDVAVIGGGIVGLSAAIRLKTLNPGLEVFVFEQGPIAMGATSRNAGFATFGTVGELSEDLRQRPAEEVGRLSAERLEGLKLLRSLTGEESIRYEDSGGYEIFTEKAAYEKSLDDLPFINTLLEEHTGIKSIFQPLTDIRHFGFSGVCGIIRNPYEGLLHSGHLLKTLEDKAKRMGVPVYGGFRLHGFENDTSGIKLRFDRPECTVTAKKVLLCTNGFTGNLIHFPEVKPARGLILVTEKLDAVSFRGGFHHHCGYDYFREVDGRVLLGGGRNLAMEAETSTEDETNPVIFSYLKEFLQGIILPGKAPKIEYVWTGTMGVGEGKYPIIREIEKNIFCAVRMGGMGVAIGTKTGFDAADLILSE